MVSLAIQGRYAPGGQQKKRRRQGVDLPSPETLGITWGSTSGDLLQWLLRYPFQGLEDLALVKAVDRSSVSRQIAKLEQLGLVEWVYPPSLGSDVCTLYYLNAAGITTVAALEQADPAALARAWGADERGLLRLLPRLPALVYLQNVINGLIARAPVALAEPRSGLEVNWQWHRDYAHRFSYHQRDFRCVADAVVVFHLHPMADSWKPEQERWYCAFIVLDTGLTGNHDERLIASHLAHFLRYRESEERTAQHRYFPPLLVLVQAARQRDMWLRAAREAAEGLHLSPLVGALAYVPREADIPSSWPLNWQTLTAGTSCRLEHLLAPMPEEALPVGALRDGGGQPAVRPASAEKRRGVFLAGQFTERAKEIGQDEPGAKAEEREVLALLGLRLERRHLDVLQAIYSWPGLSIGELAALLDLRKESAERYLYELRHTFCLQEYDTRFGTRMYLSSRGLRLVALQLGVSVLHIAAPLTKEDFPHRGQRVRLRHDLDHYPRFFAEAGATGVILSTNADITVQMDRKLAGTQEDLNCITWRVREKEVLTEAFSDDCELLSPQEDAAGDEEYGELVQRSIRVLMRRLVDDPGAVRHTAGIYSFFARLHVAARSLKHEVRWWETGSRCERRYRDHDSWHNLRPDAAMEYMAGGKLLRAWLEWDEGTMKRRNLEPKLEAYATYVRTREWSREGLRVLPVLLIVAPNREQESRVADMARSCLADTGLTACVTTASRITDVGVLAPIWAQVVPETDAPIVRRRLPDVKGEARGG
jgi:DNA-binding MarR family transcriptional regulator